MSTRSGRRGGWPPKPALRPRAVRRASCRSAALRTVRLRRRWRSSARPARGSGPSRWRPRLAGVCRDATGARTDRDRRAHRVHTGSIRETVPSSVFTTQTAPAPKATAVGPLPTPIVCVTSFDAGSTRTSRFSALSLIQTAPAPTAMPRPAAPSRTSSRPGRRVDPRDGRVVDVRHPHRPEAEGNRGRRVPDRGSARPRRRLRRDRSARPFRRGCSRPRPCRPRRRCRSDRRRRGSSAGADGSRRRCGRRCCR